MWTIPLDAGTDAIMCALPLMVTLPSADFCIVIFCPFTSFSVCPSCNKDVLRPPTNTWYCKMSFSFSLFYGFIKSSTVPFGSLSNAALVGAKTVNGPAFDKASTNSACFTAATKVV